jgi:NAD(P)-dependent dehydrogenase (short-subunit alcohol dehydrogenase family)
MHLENLVVGITGAASGIGQACAVAAAAEGADVALGDIDTNGLRETAAMVTKAGRRVVTCPVDVTTDDDQAKLVNLAVGELGGLHGWVGSAGIGAGFGVLEHTRESWRKVMDVNVEGLFFGAQEAARHMVENGGGSIVTIASMYGQRAVRQRAAYCTSKAAVIMLTQVMALEFAGQSIRVNAVAPGYTDTPLFRRGLKRDNLALDRMLDRVPAGRLGSPKEMGSAVAFLLSDKASFVTGHTLTVDGGWVNNGSHEGL